MKLVQYEREVHNTFVFDLWQRTAGQQYPLSIKDFSEYINERISYEDGDGIVAVKKGQVIGFGMVEIDHKNPRWNGWGGIMILLVDPEYQRQGIGSSLLKKLEIRMGQVGCKEMHLGQSRHSFWPGTPADMPAAKPFFQQHGYDFSKTTIAADLVIALEGYQMTSAANQALDATEAEISCTTLETFKTVCQFEQREFPYWYSGLLETGSEDVHNILAIWRRGEVIGTVITNTPKHPGIREKMIGPDVGGFGAVGIAKAWRGRGLGTAMCQSAALYVKKRGAQFCMIDEVAPEVTDFYKRIGAKIWREFHRAEKYVR